jgi:ABC-type phosphate transport system auxiliary subunit
MSENEASRVPLAELADLMAAGEPLPFKVMDSQGRLLLAAGHRVLDPRQMAALLEREACADAAEVQAVRQARGSTGAAVNWVSMSSGSTSTTGPGRPCIAVWKARAMYSGRRSAC